MRLVLSIVLSLFLVGCFSQNLEEVGQDIVTSLNNKDYNKLWDKYIDQGTKVKIELGIDDAKKTPQLGSMMMSMVGIPDDRIDNITPKEYFGYLMSFSMRLGSMMDDKERSSLIYKSVKIIDNSNAVIILEGTAFMNKLYLVKIEGKWYLNMEDN